MEVATLVVTSTNTLALLALAFRAGKLVDKLENAERRIEILEASKMDVTLAKIGEQVSGFKENVSGLRHEMSEVKDEIKSWRLLWSNAPARSG
jgi:hypothetical protein